MHSIRFYSPVHAPRILARRFATHADADAELKRLNRLSQGRIRAEVVTVDAVTHIVIPCSTDDAPDCRGADRA